MTYRSLTRAAQPVVEPVTITEAKAHLRVDTDDDNSYIMGLVAAARGWVEEYLDRSLVYTQWTMRMDAIPWEIELPRPPVAQAGTTTATVVTYTLETQATATLDTSTYRVDRTATPGVIRTVYAGTWPSHLFDENSVSVTWWGGYGADGTAVPAAVRSAMLMVVSHLYEHRTAVAPGMSEVPFGVKALLDTQRWGSYR